MRLWRRSLIPRRIKVEQIQRFAVTALLRSGGRRLGSLRNANGHDFHVCAVERLSFAVVGARDARGISTSATSFDGFFCDTVGCFRLTL